MLSCRPVIAGVFSTALTFQFTGSHHFPQCALNRADAKCRTKFPDVLLSKTPDLVLCGKSYGVKLT